MPITDYASLRSTVDSYLVYSDVDSMFDTFLQLTEARINREVRVREMETVESRVANASQKSFLLNSSFLEMISITEVGMGSLEYVTPRMIREALALSPAQGQPRLYSIMDENVYLHPKTDSERTYTLDYYSKITPLTSTVTNVILGMAPDLYLYGVLSEAQPYLGDADRSAEYNALFQRSINAINTQDTRSRQRPGARIMTSVTRDGAFRIA
jgi:hypothetical protein